MTTWVLLRGLAREAGHWGGFEQRLAHRIGQPVVLLDLPGSGRLRWQSSPASVSGIAAACRRELALRGIAPPYALLALSLGAMVAIEWCCIAPSEVKACVLINSSLGGLNPFWQRLQPRNYLRLLSLALPGMPPIQRERAVLAMTSARPAIHVQLPLQWVAMARQRPMGPWTAVRQLTAAARYVLLRERPPVPLLVLASSGDTLVSPRCSERLAQHWNLPLAQHDWAGHDLPLDDPEWVLIQVAQWWSVQRDPRQRD